jgi:hypothetical protein
MLSLVTTVIQRNEIKQRTTLKALGNSISLHFTTDNVVFGHSSSRLPYNVTFEFVPQRRPLLAARGARH